MDLHDCCEEYAEGCVSCSLHADIRKDERQVISTLLDTMVDWKNQELRSRVLNLVSKGSSIKSSLFIEEKEVDVDRESGSAYVWIKKDQIKPPLTTLTDVECNIDVDADREVIGLEIFHWPGREEDR